MPLPVAFIKVGVANVGSPFSRATMSVAIEKGFAPARPETMLPRVRPHHNWLGESVGPLELSTAGSGTEPSPVWPYQILLIAIASVRLTQFGLVLVPIKPPWPA